jgi:hypothetical protein
MGLCLSLAISKGALRYGTLHLVWLLLIGPVEPLPQHGREVAWSAEFTSLGSCNEAGLALGSMTLMSVTTEASSGFQITRKFGSVIS